MTGDQIYALERTGVVRVQATTCDGSGSGSGYFISDRMVVTAAHVVDGATAVSLRGDHGVVRGTIVGLDKAKDVALVRAEPDSQGRSTTASSSPSPPFRPRSAPSCTSSATPWGTSCRCRAAR
ncbi:MAG: trypsin-like peptidase domain-containing protein [Dermatophilaceae bacterium]